MTAILPFLRYIPAALWWLSVAALAVGTIRLCFVKVVIMDDGRYPEYTESIFGRG